MMHIAISVLAGTALLAAVGFSDDGAGKTKAKPTLHDFTVRDIDGETVSLAKYRDQVCLIVNVASR